MKNKKVLKASKVEVKVKKNAGPKKIFIVEDNLMYLKSMEIFLNEQFPDADISRFPNGELCLHSLHLNPDYIIMDYFLDSRFPKAYNGLEMIKQIRAKKNKAEIIVHSSQDKIEIAVEAAKGKKCHYVPKNVNAFENIISIIRKKWANAPAGAMRA